MQAIIATFPTAYIERSPSGNGIHIIFLVDISRIPAVNKEVSGKTTRALDPKYYSKNPHNKVEAYVAGLTNRYFTFTEDTLQDGKDGDQTDEFLKFLDVYMLREAKSNEQPTKGKAQKSTASTDNEESQSLPRLSDDEVLTKARGASNGAKFTALYDEGSTKGYDSHSNADSALCAMLAFYTGGDVETIDRLFRQSKLYREKWEREDYRRSTIEKAVELCDGKFYRSKKPGFIIYDPRIKGLRVVPPLLAKHFRENQRYIFAKDSAKGGVNRFVYMDGYYQLCSDEMFKGIIKGYICEYDETLVRMADVNEVFSNLSTDLKFVAYEELNADEDIINFTNGLLRLSDMTLLPHSADVLSTVQIPCAWAGKPTPTPNFDAYIFTLANHDTTIEQLLLEFMGATLSNIKGWRMKKSLFLKGKGDTGKSQLKSLAERLLGRGNFISIDLKDLEARFGTANLYNKRLAGSSDMSFMTVDELKVFKKATGGDSLWGEFKGQNGFEFVYNGLLWFCMNRLPKFGGDDGQWVYDRIIQVDCLNVIPLDKQDKQLLDKMFAEREGIVYRSIMALKRVIANGYRFSEPDSVIQARADYRAENNTIIAFWNECMVRRPNAKIEDGCTTSRVYNVYKAWCSDNNNGFYKNMKEFRAEVCALLGVEKHDSLTVRRNVGQFYVGYTLCSQVKVAYERAYDEKWGDRPPIQPLGKTS